MEGKDIFSFLEVGVHVKNNEIGRRGVSCAGLSIWVDDGGDWVQVRVISIRVTWNAVIGGVKGLTDP